ncbi:flagellar hook-basal body protein [Gynuella sp.]|uniref:flagellar hook-basal body protein n=1 Tax=Gynuella sp. TaxID=2969146 RepID=UPI003D10391C
MQDSMHIAALGMESQQTMVDTISNNIANINTQSFKAAQVNFEDLVGKRDGAQDIIPGGAGVRVAGLRYNSTPGDLKQTDNEMDIAIAGKGFFELISDNGDLLYTRNGSLKINADSILESVNGLPLSALIEVPSDYTSLAVANDGTVLADVPDQKDPVILGQLELAHFINPEGLESLGNGLYRSSQDSGEAQYFATDSNPSKILQGYVETSNVNMVQELTSLVLAQKAYGLNSRILQASDEILGLINDLRRG